MPRSTAPTSHGKSVILALVLFTVGIAPLCAQENFKTSGSRRPYTHLITLYDADGVAIDPTAAGAKPYSPHETCKKCHDLSTIAGGTHFVGSSTTPAGRPGEPFIWIDKRTGTQLPLSYRGWPGTHHPERVGFDAQQFTAHFARHLPGTGFALADGVAQSGAADDAVDTTALPAIDCLFCHTAGREYRHSKWIDTVKSGAYDWAAAVASGLAKARGAPSEDGTPKYDSRRFDSGGQVFFDVVKRTPNDTCYACHTAQPVGRKSWLHDGDVHLRAGMLCVDCHRNGLDHQTVRGFEGEQHSGGAAVETLTCRGCHLDELDHDGNVVRSGGRLGAPRPLHRGLPPLHLEKMTCTSCHSGVKPTPTATDVQTSLAHGLGIASQDRTDRDSPRIVEPVLLRNADGRLAPHRMMWPSFWGWLDEDVVTPMPPKSATRAVRRAFRVRQDFPAEVRPDGATPAEHEAAFLEKLNKTLTALQANAPEGAQAIFVSGGQLYDGQTQRSHPAAEPYAWPIAHDVRPARDSLGSGGCVECHSKEAPLLHATISTSGPAPVTEVETHAAHELAQLDATLLSVWEESFTARDTFKLLATIALGVVAAVLLVALLTLGRSRVSARNLPSEPTPNGEPTPPTTDTPAT